MKLLIVIFFLSGLPLGAVLSSSTVFELRTAGSDTNGGGYVTGSSGADMSQFNNKNAVSCTSCFSAVADLSTVDLVTNGTTTVTSATALFSTLLPGNIIYIVGGTGAITPAWYQVVSRTNVTTLVLDRSTGLTTGAGATINIGGALQSVGAVSALLTVSGMVAYMQNAGSVFAITSATPSVSGGSISVASNAIVIVGYVTSRNVMNADPSPTIQVQASSVSVFSGARAGLINVILDGNSQTSVKAMAGGYLYKATIENFNTASTGVNVFVGILATANSAAVLSGSAGTQVAYSEAYGNTATPIVASFILNTLTYLNTGSLTDGASTVGSSPAFVSGLTAVGNGRDGFRPGGSAVILVQDSYAGGQAAGWGFNNAGLNIGLYNNNGTYNNLSGGISVVQPSGYAASSIAVSGDPFTNAAGNVYTLNNLVNQGALLRATATPSLFPRGLTANYRDVNAPQTQGGAMVSVGYVQ